MVSNIIDFANECPAKPPHPNIPVQARILEVLPARDWCSGPIRGRAFYGNDQEEGWERVLRGPPDDELK